MLNTGESCFPAQIISNNTAEESLASNIVCSNRNIVTYPPRLCSIVAGFEVCTEGLTVAF